MLLRLLLSRMALLITQGACNRFEIACTLFSEEMPEDCLLSTGRDVIGAINNESDHGCYAQGLRVAGGRFSNALCCCVVMSIRGGCT